jgi:hypothetical protein
MQSERISDSDSSESEAPPDPSAHPPKDGFKMTPHDINILRRYMEEFEQSDTQMRNKILEKAMGEIYRLRPGNSAFDKKDAKQVCLRTLQICVGLLIDMHSRKSESGSTITTLPLIVRS